MYESIVNNQIINYLEKPQLLSPNQFGFRRGVGTSDLLTALHCQWVENVALGGQVTLAIDIAGAFDRVSHPGLISKLSMYGIRGRIHRWLQSYLSNRKLCAVVDGHTSSQFPVAVPQGSILGPTLFLLYINDLEDNLPTGIDLAIYADDTIIYGTMSCQDDAIGTTSNLQSAVDAIQEWGNAWRVTFEPKKSQSMVISTKRSPWPCPDIIFNGLPVPEVQELKLLGVHFDAKLSFAPHLRRIAVRANRRLAFLRKASRVLDSHGRMTVYKRFV